MDKVPIPLTPGPIDTAWRNAQFPFLELIINFARWREFYVYIRYRSLIYGRRRNVDRDIIVTKISITDRTSIIKRCVKRRMARYLAVVFASGRWKRPTNEVEMELPYNEDGSIDWRIVANGAGEEAEREEAVVSDEERKVKHVVLERRKEKRNVTNRAFTTSRRLHMRLLSALETFMRAAAALLHSRDAG